MENIQSCFAGNGSKGLEYIRRSQKQPCNATNLTIREDFCGSELNYPISGEQAITAAPAASFKTRITAIVAIQYRSFTIAFAGTADGHLKKILIKSKTHAIEYDDFEIHKNSAIRSNLQIDAEQAHLYAITKDRLTKAKLYNCDDFSDCPECSQTNDPYCEWCFMENKCNSPNASLSFFIIGNVILVIVAIFVMIILSKRHEERLKQKFFAGNPIKISKDLTLAEQAEYLPYDRSYEFPQERLKIDKEHPIGSGAFGVVYKAVAAHIKPDEKETIVAVKKNSEKVY